MNLQGNADSVTVVLFLAQFLLVLDRHVRSGAMVCSSPIDCV